MRSVSTGKFTRMYKLNETVFDTIDTSEKAYWLGFLAADGCVYVNSHTKSKGIRLLLSDKDSHHLEKFRGFIGDEKAISDIQNNNHVGVAVNIYSSHMFNSLCAKGIKPAKSLSLGWINLRSDLMSHFIRGYNDGDGCFTVGKFYYTRNNGQKRVYTGINWEVLGTRPFLEGLLHHLPANIQKRSRISLARSNSPVYRLRFFSSKFILLQELYSFLYRENTVCLERKEKVLHDYIQNSSYW
jgi:hypothetical protein